jgi:hypothetical protein
MVILELLARAYEPEHVAERLEPPVGVDEVAVAQWAQRAFELEHGPQAAAHEKRVRVAHAADVPEGERKIVQVGGLSIGVFHHKGARYAVRSS